MNILKKQNLNQENQIYRFQRKERALQKSKIKCDIRSPKEIVNHED